MPNKAGESSAAADGEPAGLLEQYKAMTKRFKTMMTKTEKVVKEQQSQVLIDNEDLEVRLDNLVKTYTRYENLQFMYESSLSEQVDDVDHDVTEERYYRLVASIKRLLKSSDLRECSNSVESVVQCKPRNNLPEMTVPLFDGRDITKFRPFMELYKAIIGNDVTLIETQKLYYLKMYLKGEALALVDTLPLEKKSYDVAIDLLEKRYDDKCLLIIHYVNQLLDFQALVRGTAQCLRQFVSHVRQQLGALHGMQQPVDNWDMILIPILTRKLDQYTCRAYHLERDCSKLPSVKDFLDFLERRAVSLEQSNKTESKTYSSFNKPKINLVSLTKATNRPTESTASCNYCNEGSHRLFSCPKFQLISVDDRLLHVSKNKLCTICLNDHGNKKCKFNFKCAVCKSQEHNTLLHVVTEHSNHVASADPVNFYCDKSTNVILPTIKVKVKTAHGSYITARALLDSGSQSCFLTNELANKLGIKSFNHRINVKTLGENNNSVQKACVLMVNSNDDQYSREIVCSVVDSITSALPQFHINVPNSSYKHLPLADDEFNVPGSISLLLSSNIFFDALLPEKKQLGGIVLQNTRFGYIVAGEVQGARDHSLSSVTTMHCAAVNDTPIESLIQRFWEVESVPTIEKEATSEYDICEAEFQSSVQLIDNRFQVKLPLKCPIEELPIGNSFGLAMQRLNNINRKMLKNENLKHEYCKFINDYVSLGHARVVDLNNHHASLQSMWFLPHHAVIREDKKFTKTRVVFDGSATNLDKISLNDMLYAGDTVQKGLFEILLTFRTYEYVFICDIQQMFRQIRLHPDHTRLQNILWRESANDEVQIIELLTVTYGLRCSSFLATRCLIELARRYGDQYPLAANMLINNTYVDDVLGGSLDKNEAIETKRQLIDLLGLGGFKLHKWCSNHLDILDGIDPQNFHFDEVDLNKEALFIKTLGMTLDFKTDQFKMVAPIVENCERSTKRNVLAYISKFYDPLGLVGPILVRGKLIMQMIWQSRLGWDEEVTNDIKDQWLKFKLSLATMPPICVQRNVQMVGATFVQLVGFCDASRLAFGCAVYIKTKANNVVNVNLLCAKSRVAPPNGKLTIPKLELCSALLLSDVMTKVQSLLKIDNIILYSDSMVALGWIKNKAPSKLEIFVKNRVNKIVSQTPSDLWYHVPGISNPADCLSRGVDPQSLASNVAWWKGPTFLYKQDQPLNQPMNELFIAPESGQLIEQCNVNTSIEILPILKNCSNLHRMIHVIAYVYRYFNVCKAKLTNNILSLNRNISPAEFKQSLLKIIACYQNEYFADDIRRLHKNLPVKSNLKSLCPFVDIDSVLRVGGRLQHADLQYDGRHPVILPKKCHLTDLIIRSEHERLLHAGHKLTLSSLSSKYWIVSGAREVKRNINKCVKCFKAKAEACRQLMGSLPLERINISHVFQNVGIDFCGPFNIKESRKRSVLITKAYVAIYVCFATKCVHMELVSSMSTDAFLASFKRFISRRGLPVRVFCDNGTNFKGAGNQLRDLYKLFNAQRHQDEIENFSTLNGIEFKFIPSYSPTFGGLWEAAVKGAKFYFKRIISDSIFTYEEFYTILVQVEGVMNSRPLTAVSRDPTDFNFLTPGHFLIGRSITMYPEPDYTSVPSNRLKYWRQCTKMTQSFWKVWKTQYLTLLQNRPKWHTNHPNLEADQLVLLKDDNAPSMTWPLARIISVVHGPDGKVRIVNIKTPNGKLSSRAVNKVCLLPIYDKE